MPNVHHATRGRGRVPARGITRLCPIVGELLAPRARPFGARPGIYELSTKAILELLRVRSLRKTEDEHVGVIATEGVRARAQREPFAEEADCYVVVAGAASGRDRHLVGPVPIHRAFAELSLAVDHGASTHGRRPRSTLLAGATGEALVAFAELAGGVRGVYQRRNKKGTYFEGPVEAEHAMADSLEQLRALEREVEREWW